MYKKVYVEITNYCNLSCPFCLKTNREKRLMQREEFDIILDKLNGYTKYLYFHVLGEPLMHPQINDFIDMAVKKNYYVNLTTNGYLLDRVKMNKNIRQINISLHSFVEGKILLDIYMKNILECVEVLKKYTYISFRLWVHTKYKDKILSFLEEYYHTKIKESQKLEKNVFIAFEHSFTWPSLDLPKINEFGTCYALKDHLAILCNGDVVPCCLDGGGQVIIGNILKDNIKDIEDSERYQKILEGFKQNRKVEALCQRCDFRDSHVKKIRQNN